MQSYLFDKSKGWTVEKAKAWFEEHQRRERIVREHYVAVFPFQVLEKVVDKPLCIRAIAMKVGTSRNLNIYTPEELQGLLVSHFMLNMWLFQTLLARLLTPILTVKTYGMKLKFMMTNTPRKALRSCMATQNPKVIELVKVLEAQLQVKPDSRLIVFIQYRDTVNALIKVLNNNSKLRVERFVGQGEREDDPGMSQEQQREVLEKLRSGETNVLWSQA